MGHVSVVVTQFALAIACAGCNGVFGLGGQVELVDATYFDAPVRIPTCPPTGSGLPTFGEAVHEVIDAAGCHSYNVASDGTAMAICPSTTISNGSVWVAEPGAALSQLDLSPQYIGIYDARLSGDGNLALIQAATSSGEVAFALHHDRTAHAWTSLAGTVPTDSGTIASPSSGPAFTLIYFYLDADIGYALYEFSGDGNAWSPVASYSALGAASVMSASMTPDGLHLVADTHGLSGGPIAYSDRATLADHFTTFRELDTVPETIMTPYLTDNCERLYFTALGRVLYLEQ